MAYKTILLVIDPQNSFCDPAGELFVTGANKDMERLAAMIHKHGSRLDDIHVTLDTHHIMDVAHPLFWVNSANAHPAPFTLISYEDVKNGTWGPAVPSFVGRMLHYTKSLETNGRYVLCVWPEHCLIGHWGHNLFEPMRQVLDDWEKQNIALVDFVTKGTNIFTEHYSAVQADVPDANDPTTQLNTRLIQALQDADKVLLAGEALSHCVANTVTDIADTFGDANIKKLWLLEDCSSSVPSFESLGTDFINRLVARGMNVTTSDKALQ